MTPGCTASLSGKYQAGEIGVGGGPNRELSVPTSTETALQTC
jgi:hypothetical protein